MPRPALDPSGSLRFWWKCSVDQPDVARSIGATRMDVPGERRVHLTGCSCSLLLSSASSVSCSSVSDFMVHASSVIAIVEDS